MNADEVYKIVEARQSAHENKCDERQTVIHRKIDNLSRWVHIGIGGLMLIQLLILLVGPGLLTEWLKTTPT